MQRADGTLKPHAEVVRRFAAREPSIATAVHPVELDIDASAFYDDPRRHASRLYERWRSSVAGDAP